MLWSRPKEPPLSGMWCAAYGRRRASGNVHCPLKVLIRHYLCWVYKQAWGQGKPHGQALHQWVGDKNPLKGSYEPHGTNGDDRAYPVNTWGTRELSIRKQWCSIPCWQTFTEAICQLLIHISSLVPIIFLSDSFYWLVLVYRCGNWGQGPHRWQVWARLQTWASSF